MKKEKKYKNNGWMIFGVSPAARNIACIVSKKEKKKIGKWIDELIMKSQDMANKEGISIPSLGKVDGNRYISDEEISDYNNKNQNLNNLKPPIYITDKKQWWKFW